MRAFDGLRVVMESVERAGKREIRNSYRRRSDVAGGARRAAALRDAGRRGSGGGMWNLLFLSFTFSANLLVVLPG